MVCRKIGNKCCAEMAWLNGLFHKLQSLTEVRKVGKSYFPYNFYIGKHLLGDTSYFSHSNCTRPWALELILDGA